MKKILACALALVTLLTCAAFGVSAADTGVIAVENTTASIGSTVEVDVNITKNPGVVSVYLSLTYDTTRLELVQVKETGFVGDPFHSQSVSAYPFNLNWDGGNLLANVTGTGTLGTLVFKVKDDAPLGDAFVAVEQGAGGIINFDFAFSASRLALCLRSSHASAAMDFRRAPISAFPFVMF